MSRAVEIQMTGIIAILLHGYGSKQIAAAVRKSFGELPPWVDAHPKEH